MKVKVLANVQEIERKSEYAKKQNGQTDFDAPKIEHFESTLRILDNEFHILGQFVVRERLDFGSLYEIFLNTDQGQQVAEIEEDSAELLSESNTDLPEGA